MAEDEVKPASPLPWTAEGLGSEGYQVCSSQPRPSRMDDPRDKTAMRRYMRLHKVAQFFDGEWDDLKRNAIYAVHAANEYPKLRERVRELEDALAFYAKPKNYYLGDYESNAIHDNGDIARKALEARDAK